MTSKDFDLEKLESKKEVFIAEDQAFEAPAKEFIPGPYYKNIEEVMPELSEFNAQDDDNVDSKSKLPVDRRDFMRLFGASAIMASTACVRRPVERAVPYVNQPNDMTIGLPIHYATTLEGAGVIVKTREGRPVFLEGNPEHPLSQGAVGSMALSELQALYHPDRRKSPKVLFGNNRMDEASWDEVFARMAPTIEKSKRVAILAKETTGSSAKFYKEFLKKIGQSENDLYLYDTNQLRNATEAAYKIAYGVDGMPRTDLRRAEYIVGVGAEFLDIGTAHVYESKSWTASHTFRYGRKGKMVQFESRLTNTGGKADERHVIGTGDELAITLAIVEALMKNPASKGTSAEKSEFRKVLSANSGLIASTKKRLHLDDKVFTDVAKDLLAKKSIVMAGESAASSENATMIQLAAIMANVLCGAFANKTLFLDRGWMKSSAGAGDISRFLNNAQDIDFLFVIDVNPAFTLPNSTNVREKLAKIENVASIQSMPCETDKYANFVLNSHNVLESWGDQENVAGFWSIVQPTVRPFTNSMQAEDILLWTAAKMNKPLGFREYRDYVRSEWKKIHKARGVKHDFDVFFKAVQRKGFYGKIATRKVGKLKAISESFTVVQPKIGGLKLVAHLDARLLDGRGANRPVLQETGDSMTTITWDTWVGINPHTARKLGVKYNDVVKVKGPNGTVEAAVYPLPGLHPETVVIPRGNGHDEGVSRVTDGFGVNPLSVLAAAQDSVTGEPVTAGQRVEIVATGKFHQLAALQKHNDIADRHDIVKEVSLAKAVKNMRKTRDLDDVPDIYPELKSHPDYRWGMSIDLDKCTGCGACSIACDLDNNVPQIGREQILKGREMHWLRIDRYFKGSVDNPEVTFQPVGCQHCNHAPCEAVCPVFATTHDEEGFNAQTYNRCVGTRYCANACPYKVRRFNWFTHKWNVIGERQMDRNPRALNPDITVRTRGVMEKCTFCVGRIREAKWAAKSQNRKVRDGEIRTACESVCSTDAIVFGNLKDPNSRISQLRRDYRSYLMLGGDHDIGHYGIKTLPNVSYMAKVTLKEDKKGGHDHH